MSQRVTRSQLASSPSLFSVGTATPPAAPIRRSRRRAARDAAVAIHLESQQQRRSRARGGNGANNSPVVRRSARRKAESPPDVPDDDSVEIVEPLAVVEGSAKTEGLDPQFCDPTAKPPADFTCPICLDAPAAVSDVATLDGCTHRFCWDCINKWVETENRCPCCKARYYKIERAVPLAPLERRGKRKRSSSGSASKRARTSARVNSRTISEDRTQRSSSGFPINAAVIEQILASFAGINGGNGGPVQFGNGNGPSIRMMPGPPGSNNMVGVLEMVVPEGGMGALVGNAQRRTASAGRATASALAGRSAARPVGERAIGRVRATASVRERSVDTVPSAQGAAAGRSPSRRGSHPLEQPSSQRRRGPRTMIVSAAASASSRPLASSASSSGSAPSRQSFGERLTSLYTQRESRRAEISGPAGSRGGRANRQGPSSLARDLALPSRLDRGSSGDGLENPSIERSRSVRRSSSASRRSSVGRSFHLDDASEDDVTLSSLSVRRRSRSSRRSQPAGRPLSGSSGAASTDAVTGARASGLTAGLSGLFGRAPRGAGDASARLSSSSATTRAQSVSAATTIRRTRSPAARSSTGTSAVRARRSASSEPGQVRTGDQAPADLHRMPNLAALLQHVRQAAVANLTRNGGAVGGSPSPHRSPSDREGNRGGGDGNSVQPLGPGQQRVTIRIVARPPSSAGGSPAGRARGSSPSSRQLLDLSSGRAIEPRSGGRGRRAAPGSGRRSRSAGGR